MSSYPPSFDELYSISDLHLGGSKGFQIFDQGQHLAAVLDLLAARPAGRRVVLVINGDVVDFLAEKPQLYLDAERAVAKLERIFGDTAFAPFWQALGRYVRTKDRWLAVTLGNHDLELALPAVRERLLEELAGDDLEARGRVLLALDGTGFACEVGGARVLAVHGNEVDTWNVTDHERLRRLARDQNQRRPTEPWTPNAGTKLVIDIMNSVKEHLPLVDLLKPEKQAVVPVILALDPSQARKLAGIAPVLLRLTTDRVRQLTGFLSADEEVSFEGGPPPAEPSAAMDQLLGGTFGRSATPAAAGDASDLLDMAEMHLRAGTVPMAGQGSGDETLGVGGMVWDLIRGRSPEENLRDALEGWLAEDLTFDFREADATFQLLDKEIGPDVDFLLTGHTHLEKALRRGRGNGSYFNSGTWIRLIQLTPEMLRDRQRFRQIYEAFKGGTMAALDAVPGLVLRRPTVISIQREEGGVYGELCHAELDRGKIKLKPVEGSRLAAR